MIRRLGIFINSDRQPNRPDIQIFKAANYYNIQIERERYFHFYLFIKAIIWCFHRLTANWLLCICDGQATITYIHIDVYELVLWMSSLYLVYSINPLNIDALFQKWMIFG